MRAMKQARFRPDVVKFPPLLITAIAAELWRREQLALCPRSLRMALRPSPIVAAIRWSAGQSQSI